MVRTEQLGQPGPALARQLHEVWRLAQAQEVALLRGGLPTDAPRQAVDQSTDHAATPAITEVDDDTLADHFSQDGAHRIAAFRGDQVLGWVSVGADDEPGQICITLLVVSPQHQRQGIGRLLVARVLALAGGAVVSVVTTADNTPALALYRQLGFVPYRSGSLGDGAVPVVKLRTAGQQALLPDGP